MPLRGTWSERVFSQIRHRNALTKIAWEDTGQGLEMTMSTVASEKNISFIGRVLQTVTSLGVVSLVFSAGHDLLKITNFNPQQEARPVSLWKKLVPRESGGNGVLV